MAAAFLEGMGRNPEAPAQLAAPDSILADRFLKTSVGLFDVWIPTADLEDAETARDYRDSCAALCRAQAEWLEWLGHGARAGDDLREDLEELEEWIEGWDERELGAAVSGASESTEPRSAMDVLEAKDNLRELSAELAIGLRGSSLLTGEASEGGALDADVTEAAASATSEELSAVDLVLVPQRKDFVEFIAYAGWYRPTARGSFWHAGIRTWCYFTLDDLRIIALEYADPAARADDYELAMSMKAKTPTGIEQQVVHLGLQDLIACQHGDALPPSLASGLALNLVAELFGGCHTRIDGDTSARTTQAREVFVRGGRPEGGILPPNSAESRWRANHGKDHFKPILRQVQKAGAESDRGNGKYNAFQLVDEKGSARYVTQAPFLGPSAAEEEVVPDRVYGDYLEFTRAYRSAFLYWLQHHGQRSKKKAASCFAELLTRISEPEASVTAIVEELYDKPLSDPEASSKCLEGEFLRWLAKR